MGPLFQGAQRFLLMGLGMAAHPDFLEFAGARELVIPPLLAATYQTVLAILESAEDGAAPPPLPKGDAAAIGETAELFLAARDDHGITLLGPVGADTTQAQRDDGKEPLLPQGAFRIDWDARTVACPQGATSISWSDQRKPSGTPVVRVHFALADCDPCPLRSRCTRASHGRWGRSLTLLSREQHEVLARQRAEQQTPEWKARYNIRAGVEGTISQAVRRARLPASGVLRRGRLPLR